MTFKDLFTDDKERLDAVLQRNPNEQRHIQRCITLAETIEWDTCSAGEEFEEMLGAKGKCIFDKIITRITNLLSNDAAPELRNTRAFIRHLMFVHDLGKYNKKTCTYDGTNHEERSALIVTEKCETLIIELHWQEDSVALLIQLIRYHGLFGITRIGDASIVFLSPLLDAMTGLPHDRKRLFLDLLIVLTCCDAGSSGDFNENKFYLDHSRIALYDQLSDELFAVSTTLMKTPQTDSFTALLATASELINTTVRIKGIVTSSNLLTVTDDIIETVLNDLLARQMLNVTSLALTRFDHGAYVFEPLLTYLERGKHRISRESLRKFLLFIGVLCQAKERPTVIQFRNTFSMKADLRLTNTRNFKELCEAVDGEDQQKIMEILRAHPSPESH